MKKVFKATITFSLESGHPEIQSVKSLNDVLSFDDTYTMDCDYYDNEEQMIDFIKHDLSLVAGGGYSTEHIWNINFDIKRIA